AVCPRTESPKRCGGAGWLHWLTDRRPVGPFVRHVRLPNVSAALADLDRLAAECRAGLNLDRLGQFADRLGLTATSLMALGIGWSANHRAYSFPMVNASGKVVGIRLRTPTGSKFAVRGSQAGLHIPAGPTFRPGERLLV